MSDPIIEYGWWKDLSKLPKTIGHKNNLVMSTEQVLQYCQALGQMEDMVRHEHSKALRVLSAMSKKQVPSYVACPHPLTLCDVLEFKLKLGKTTLALLHSITAFLKTRKTTD